MKVTFINLLTVVFVVLKLCGKIDWSWWWVLSPLWILAVLALAWGYILATMESK